MARLYDGVNEMDCYICVRKQCYSCVTRHKYKEEIKTTYEWREFKTTGRRKNEKKESKLLGCVQAIRF